MQSVILYQGKLYLSFPMVPDLEPLKLFVSAAWLRLENVPKIAASPIETNQRCHLVTRKTS